MFSKADAARDFLSTQFPEELTGALQLNTLELMNGHFVDDRLKEHYSDLLYKVGMQSGGAAFVYVLMEHKSYNDPLTVFQVLRYMVRIWEARHKEEGFIPILPIIFYHGENVWTSPCSFHELFDFSSEFKGDVPSIVKSKYYEISITYYLYALSVVWVPLPS
ncbi:MAG: hypothetical protein EOL88_11360, partial [Bacteroidia bacterium]|nr:hypothetical protein [Bacteroidia bacterium]